LVVLQSFPAAYNTLCELATEKKVVVFSGLPGQGKSFLVQQLAHIAASTGRTVHMLMWDKTSPIFAEKGPDEFRTKEDGKMNNTRCCY
jgi:Mrp family chromosome partitioning ATPase